MSKKVQVLGIDIDNHTIREIMFLLEEYTNGDGLNMAGVITSDFLVMASENPKLKHLLDSMDLQIIGDMAIYEVLEESYEQQVNELQRRDLEEKFLNSLIRKKKTVYWISDSELDLPILQDYMAEHYPKLNIEGSYTGELGEDNIGYILNEINSVAPDVILFQTSSLNKVEFIVQYKNQLNVKLCICMGYRIKSKYWTPNRNSKIKTLLDQTIFKRKAIRYQADQE